MFDYLKKFLYVLPASKFSLVVATIIFVVSSCIEAFGIGIIGPFIALASDFETIGKYPLLISMRNVLGIEQDGQLIAIFGLFAISIFLVKSFVSFYTQVYITKFCDAQQRLLIIRMTRKYLEAPYVYHISKNSSAIIDRLIEVANTFATTVFMPLLTTIANLFLFTAIFALLCITSLQIMLGLLAALFPVFIFFNSFAPKLKLWGRQIRESKADVIQTVNHAFGSIKETKIIGCEGYFEDQIADQAKILETAHYRYVSFRILPRYLIEGMIVFGVIASVSLAILISGEGIAGTTSALSVFALASIRLLPAIAGTINGVSQIRASSFTVNQFYHELSELSSFDGKQELSDKAPDGFYRNDADHQNEAAMQHHFKFDHQIKLEGITYRYPASSSDVIADLSLSINKSESIAFIGESGAGKTTLVDIILGLLIPQHGDLTVDGLSVYEDLRAWKNLIAYIPQSIFLIDDTVEKNIAFGVPDRLIDQEKVFEAIRIAQLEEVVSELPKGIYTSVGERGVLLSGGQRQRIGIARAIYHDREILVLDEATSALDDKTEKLVTESIASLSSNANITLITIAHRLSTIKDCDRVCVLEGGKIAKIGQFSDVIEGVKI